MSSFQWYFLIGAVLGVVLCIGIYVDYRDKKKREEKLNLKRSALIAMLNGDKRTLGEIMDDKRRCFKCGGVWGVDCDHD